MQQDQKTDPQGGGGRHLSHRPSQFFPPPLPHFSLFLIMNTPRIISLCSALAFLASCDQEEEESTTAKEPVPQPSLPQASTPKNTESTIPETQLPLPTATTETEVSTPEITPEAPFALPINITETDDFTPETTPEAPFALPTDITETDATERETCQAETDTDVRTRGMKVKKSVTAPAIPQDEEEATEPSIPAEMRYNNGEGAPTDAKQAIKWYKEFADAGIADAQYKLAECYYNTRSESLNFVKAVEQYRAAAEQGHTDACRKLAQCYQMGIGTEASEEEAKKWLSAAGDTPAQPNAEESADNM